MFEDLAERAHLSQRAISDDERFSQLCFHEIRCQFHYSPGATWSVSHYRTRGGAAVPFVFRSGSAVLGVIPLESPESFERFMGSVRSFLGYFANFPAKGAFIQGRLEH
jgi:hypothetical protein